MRDLNHLNDNIVVFTAIEEGMGLAPSSSGATRTPLQSLTTELSSNSTPSNIAKDSTPVKIETSYSSPYIIPPSVPVKDEGGSMPSMSHVANQTSKWPWPQGFSQCSFVSELISLTQEALLLGLSVVLPLLRMPYPLNHPPQELSRVRFSTVKALP
jgi:hypothetical protein